MDSTARKAPVSVPDLLAYLSRFASTRGLAASLAGALELHRPVAASPPPAR
jgi:hypothetical protein